MKILNKIKTFLMGIFRKKKSAIPFLSVEIKDKDLLVNSLKTNNINKLNFSRWENKVI